MIDMKYDRQIDRQIDKWIDRQIDRYVDRQTGRQIGRQIDVDISSIKSIIRPLCIKLLQMIGSVKCFDDNKTMSFKVTDKKLLKNYTKI